MIFKPNKGAIISAHARSQMRYRRIPESLVREILLTPDQRFEAPFGRAVLQSRAKFSPLGKTFLVRVVVGFAESPPFVVTVYRTTKVAKYWRVAP